MFTFSLKMLSQKDLRSRKLKPDTHFFRQKQMTVLEVGTDVCLCCIKIVLTTIEFNDL